MKSLTYAPRLARLFYHYKKKSSRLSYQPVRLWVELTSDCNYGCVMCPNKDLKSKDRGFMDIVLYKKIIDEAAEFAFDVNLAHRGESLLHPRLSEAIDYAKGKSLYTRLHTNGSLLTESLSRRIIQSGLDRLSFSFDGYDKETYEKIRRGGDFEKTVDNIIRFLKIKKALGSRTPKTSAEVIDFNDRDRAHMARLRKEFEAKFRGLPLNGFVFKKLHNWAGERKSGDHAGPYSVCPFPWNALVIFWDGAVLPCTQDFFGQTIIGEAITSSLKDIWNSERMVELRAKLAQGRIENFQACSRCDRPWRKRFLGVPREYLWRFLARKMP